MELSKRQDIRHIHCLGIAGAGMSGIAEILKARGYNVTGSDLAPNQTTLRLNQCGISIFFKPNYQILSKADLVIYSSAIASTHPERAWAKSQNITCISRGEALGVLIKGYHSIAIAGAHGKTSTTGLVAQLLQQNCLKPTVVIGGYLNHIKSHAVLGDGKYFVTEADESDGSLLFLNPTIGVVTQIDKEHLDYYNHDFNRLVKTYKQFIEQTQQVVILSQDDPILAQIMHEGLKIEVLSYGFSEEAMIQGVGFCQSEEGFSLTIVRKELNQSTFTIKVPLLGEHNAHNVLAAVAVATYLKIPDQVIQKSLNSYLGVARRLERLGEVKVFEKKVQVMEDYGHHPREIAATTQAIRKAFPKRRLVLVFQPHRYTRTKDLWADFAKVLAGACDQLLLLPIYAAHEPAISKIDHFALAKAIQKENGAPILVEPAKLDKTLHQYLQKDDIVLFQGAGNISQMAKDFQTTWMDLEENLQRQYP